jgi:transposase-like protein
MKRTRRKFTTAFKTKVVLEALKERSTIQELAVKFELHPNQISEWKKEFLANAEKAFEGDSEEKENPAEKERDELYKQIGQMKVEIDWLKKKVL